MRTTSLKFRLVFGLCSALAAIGMGGCRKAEVEDKRPRITISQDGDQIIAQNVPSKYLKDWRSWAEYYSRILAIKCLPSDPAELDKFLEEQAEIWHRANGGIDDPREVIIGEPARTEKFRLPQGNVVAQSKTCEPCPSCQPVIDTSEIEAFFNSHPLYAHKNGMLVKINPQDYPSGYATNIINYGWDADLLKTLEDHIKNNRLSSLSPRVRFVVDTESVYWLAWRCTNCGDLSPGEQQLIAVNLGIDISRIDEKDRERILTYVLNHELNHVREWIYFCALKPNITLCEVVKEIRKHLIRYGPQITPIKKFNSSSARLSAFLSKLNGAFIRSGGGRTYSFDQYLNEVINWAKTPLIEAQGYLNLQMHYQTPYMSRPERYKANAGKPADLAFDLLKAEKLGQSEFAQIIRQAASELPSEEKDLFDKLYDLFNLQWEVAVRFIDYSSTQ